MKKLIALRGPAKVGKSQTIRQVHDHLRVEHQADSHDDQALRVDLNVILTIDGVKIGIESQGDPGGRLEESLDLFVKVGCRVIVCATRTSGETVEAVKRLQRSENYDVLWIDKMRVSDALGQQSENNQTAARVLAEVRRVIAGNAAFKRTA